jgi:hypothetical protein
VGLWTENDVSEEISASILRKLRSGKRSVNVKAVAFNQLNPKKHHLCA